MSYEWVQDRAVKEFDDRCSMRGQYIGIKGADGTLNWRGGKIAASKGLMIHRICEGQMSGLKAVDGTCDASGACVVASKGLMVHVT